jgi:hypothetical protein
VEDNDWSAAGLRCRERCSVLTPPQGKSFLQFRPSATYTLPSIYRPKEAEYNFSEFIRRRSTDFQLMAVSSLTISVYTSAYFKSSIFLILLLLLSSTLAGTRKRRLD